MPTVLFALIFVLIHGSIFAEVSFFSDEQGKSGTVITPPTGQTSFPFDTQGTTGTLITPGEGPISLYQSSEGHRGTLITPPSGTASFYQDALGNTGVVIRPGSGQSSLYRFSTPSGQSEIGTVVSPGGRPFGGGRAQPILPSPPSSSRSAPGLPSR
jgi:hypothetical protein